jgi:hypothetical protein
MKSFCFLKKVVKRNSKEKLYDVPEVRTSEAYKVFVHNETEGAWHCEKRPKSAFFSQSAFEKHVKTKH